MITTVFFDRDGTIAKPNIEMHQKRNEYLGKLVGDPEFILTNEVKGICWNETTAEINPIVIETLEEEEEFWNVFHQILLDEIGFKGDIKKEVKNLYRMFPIYKMVKAYDEVFDVFKQLKEADIKIGIISDTFPSLEKSIEFMGLGEYVTCCVSSNEVGFYKPDPEIFEAALERIGSEAFECLFVDDTYCESEGGAAIGMRSLWINRINEDIKAQEKISDYMQEGVEVPSIKVMEVKTLKEVFDYL